MSVCMLKNIQIEVFAFIIAKKTNHEKNNDSMCGTLYSINGV